MPAVSKITFFSCVNSGRPMTTVCWLMTPCGEAQPLSGRSSISQRAAQLSLYSCGFLTIRAPADNDTRLGSLFATSISPAGELAAAGEGAAAVVLPCAELLFELPLLLVRTQEI